MGANHQSRANSNTKNFNVLPSNTEKLKVLPESVVEDITDRLVEAVEKVIKDISDAVGKAAREAVKKKSNKERSAVSREGEPSPLAPVLPINALGSLKPKPLTESPVIRPKARSPAPRVAAIKINEPVYLLGESPWRLYVKKLQNYRFSILLAIILVYLMASHGLQSATITLLRWAGTDSLRYSLQALCEGNDQMPSAFLTSNIN